MKYRSHGKTKIHRKTRRHVKTKRHRKTRGGWLWSPKPPLQLNPDSSWKLSPDENTSIKKMKSWCSTYFLKRNKINEEVKEETIKKSDSNYDTIKKQYNVYHACEDDIDGCKEYVSTKNNAQDEFHDAFSTLEEAVEAEAVNAANAAKAANTDVARFKVAKAEAAEADVASAAKAEEVSVFKLREAAEKAQAAEADALQAAEKAQAVQTILSGGRKSRKSRK